MHLSNIVIEMMIKFEMITNNWKLCWELDSKNNHEIEYHSQILVSSVNLICQDFQCILRYEYLVVEAMQGMISISLLQLTDAVLP